MYLPEMNKYFKCTEKGVPVPLKIPAKSCLKDMVKDCKLEIILFVIVFSVAMFLTWCNYQIFHNYEPQEMTAEQIKAQTQFCSDKGKKAQFLFDENYKVFFARCK